METVIKEPERRETPTFCHETAASRTETQAHFYHQILAYDMFLEYCCSFNTYAAF